MPQYVYELGGLDTRLPFEVLRRTSFINERANRAGNDPGFPKRSVRACLFPVG